jgi:hypothetical protein
MTTNRIIEAMDFESDIKNWKYPFNIMTKKYGKDFIMMLKAMWVANGDGQSEEEFCEMNDISNAFFIKVIKE